MNSPCRNSTAHTQPARGGIILILVTIVMVILAVLTTAFLTRMRNSAGAADEVVRLAQNRISLFAALTFIQEGSRLGYAQMHPTQPWLTLEHREGHGWVDVRHAVPDDSAASTSEGYVRFGDQPFVINDDGSVATVAAGRQLIEHPASRQVGPRAADGRILWPYRVRRMRGVLAIEVTNPGAGYSEDPQVVIDAPSGPGRRARARAVVRDGRVLRVEVIDPGWGYGSKPGVTIDGSASADASQGAWVDSSDWDNYVYAAVATAQPQWPAPGSTIRVPFYRQQRPPFAVDPTVVANPIPTDHSLPTFGIPFFTNPDPLPQLPPGTPFDPSNPGADTAWKTQWAAGNPNPVPDSTNLGWFRIYRETGFESDRPGKAGPPGSTFIISLGSGGTQGFRDWAEVISEGQTALFDNSEELFDMLAAGERRHHYRAEWNGGVGGGEEHLYALALAETRRIQPAPGSGGSWYEIMPPNSSRFVDLSTSGVWNESIPNVFQPSPPHPRNYIGTISYIQRLEPHTMPEHW